MTKIRAPLPDDTGTIAEQLEGIRRWGDDVARHYPRWAGAVRKLKGCDRIRLYSLLAELVNASWYPAIARKDLADCIGALESAQKAIYRLWNTQAADLVFFDDPLAENLTDQIERAKDLLRDVRKRRPLLRDLIRAALVREIRRCTGAFHDAELADLIDTAETLLLNEKVRRDSPRRVRGAARGEEGDAEAIYTPEAHRRWRERNHALVKSSSEWEDRWDKRMRTLEELFATFPNIKVRILP